MLIRRTVVILLPIALGFLAVYAPLLFGVRPLTAKELEFLTPIYGSSVDFDEIKIKTGGPLTWTRNAVTIGNTISFPTGAYDESNTFSQSILVHETCHVWQYQNFGFNYVFGSLWERATEQDAYEIKYEPDRSFFDYDVEEQCEILAEYFLTADERFEIYAEETKSITPQP